jgi:hypothetical protein
MRRTTAAAQRLCARHAPTLTIKSDAAFAAIDSAALTLLTLY